CDDPSRPGDDGGEGGDGARVVEIVSDLAQGVDGWSTIMADYPLGVEDSWELQWGYRELLPPLDVARKALFLSGINHSDDLLMGIWRRVDGLSPGAAYAVDLMVQFATEAPTGCPGV